MIRTRRAALAQSVQRFSEKIMLKQKGAMDRVSRGWLIRFTATLALLYAGCWAAPRLLGDIPQFPPATTDEIQAEVLNRYFRLPQLEIVIVGSSLAYHLKDWYFEHGNVRNAALPGGSPLTALAIIAAAPSTRPRAIAVETNVLDRALDNNVFEKFKDAKRPQRPLPPMRTLAALYQGARDDERPYSRTRIQSVIASAPAPDRSAVSVAGIWDDWNRPLNHDALLANAERLETLAERLEAQDVRVFFFEMPYPSRLRDSLYTKAMNEVFAEVIGPDDKRRLNLRYPLEEMRSVDGTHLDTRSSVIFAAALDAAITEKLGER
jgi:hypothetical protein